MADGFDDDWFLLGVTGEDAGQTPP
jgi:hypothetical protein